MKRLFVPIAPGTTPKDWVLEGDAFHYVARVLRANVGDTLEVFDGHGRSFPARVSAADPTRLSLILDTPTQSQPGREVFVVQGLPKGERLDDVLQKGTELGAAGFLPFSAERSVVQLKGDRAQTRHVRWMRIVTEAAKQCRRADVPAVHPVQTLSLAIDTLPPQTQIWVLDEEETTRSLASVVRVLRAEQPLALVVGPEGGLTRSEVGLLVGRGAQTLTLGGTILRTETAAAAVLAVMGYVDGRWG
ncbi:MAG: RsmE family RNA methyltransferase [Myxococcaceae bacterium]